LNHTWLNYSARPCASPFGPHFAPGEFSPPSATIFSLFVIVVFGLSYSISSELNNMWLNHCGCNSPWLVT